MQISARLLSWHFVGISLETETDSIGGPELAEQGREIGMQVHLDIQAQYAGLFKLRGVWAVSQEYRPKIIGTTVTEAPAVRVYVWPKRSKWICRLLRCLIPEFIDYVRTDVVAMKPMRFTQDTHLQRHDPIQGGISFCHYKCSAATLGIILRDKTSKKPKEVSNTHVIYNVDNPGGECSQYGDPQLQPGPYDGGLDPADQVGAGERYIPLVGYYPGGIADAACAVVNDKRGVKVAEILHLGKIKGVKDPELGMTLKGCCRNGDFEVHVTERAAVVNVGGLGCKLGNQYAILTKQVMYSPGLGPGSSGTCMVSEDGYAVVINSFGNGGPGTGNGGGGWFSEIMEPLNLTFEEGEEPPEPEPGEFEYSLDEGVTWQKAKKMQIRGVESTGAPAKIKVKIDGADVGEGSKVEGAVTPG